MITHDTVADRAVVALTKRGWSTHKDGMQRLCAPTQPSAAIPKIWWMADYSALCWLDDTWVAVRGDEVAARVTTPATPRASEPWDSRYPRGR